MMSATNPESEYEALVHLVHRMTLRFPEIAEDSILALVVEEYEAFDRARLRDYVPVLVERNILTQLRQDHARAA